MTKLLYKRESNVRFLVLLWFSILIAFHHFVHKPRSVAKIFVGLGLEDPSAGSNLVLPFGGLAMWKGFHKPRFWGFTITMLINTSVLHGMILQVGVGLQKPEVFTRLAPLRKVEQISSRKGEHFVFLPWCFRGELLNFRGVVSYRGCGKKKLDLIAGW